MASAIRTGIDRDQDGQPLLGVGRYEHPRASATYWSARSSAKASRSAPPPSSWTTRPARRCGPSAAIGPARDLFAVQTEIAEQVANQLGASGVIVGAERQTKQDRQPGACGAGRR
jgi:hypothetical protein